MAVAGFVSFFAKVARSSSAVGGSVKLITEAGKEVAHRLLFNKWPIPWPVWRKPVTLSTTTSTVSVRSPPPPLEWPEEEEEAVHYSPGIPPQLCKVLLILMCFGYCIQRVDCQAMSAYECQIVHSLIVDIEHEPVNVMRAMKAESKSTNDASKYKPLTATVPSTTTSNAESSTSTAKLEEELKLSSRLRKFAFNDLKLATRNFRPESLLGEGGFGCVFKGWVEENGTAPVKPGMGLTVAVKTLNHDGLQGHKEWLAEVIYLGELIHPNLVKLIGYCMEDDQGLLVYEFMPRGSLENHLLRSAAKGLTFLHEEAEKPVIYRDFKTSNILLDAEYNAKLSDFGLAKDGPEEGKTHVSTRVMGTYGYAAPEYVMTGHLTSRSDVYSFGVVLLEMITGRRSMDKSRPNGEHNLVEWARPHLGDQRRFYRLVDPRLEGHFSMKGAQKAVQLASRCLSRDPKARPLMSEVVDILKPLPHLKDMASSSSSFQSMQSERGRPNSTSLNGQAHGPHQRNGQQPGLRSLSIPNGSRASPYHHQYHPSPKPSGKS